MRVVVPLHLVGQVGELVPARDPLAEAEHLLAGEVDLVAGSALLEEQVQAAALELRRRPAVEEGRVEGERRVALVGAHLGAHAPGVVALAEPGALVDLDPLAVVLQPAAVAAELLAARHVLGDPAVAPAQVRLLLVRAEVGNEVELEGDAGFVRREHQAVPAQAFDHLDREGPDRRRQRIGTKPPRGAEVPLPAGRGDAGEGVHDVAVGVVAEADVEDDIARRRRVAGVPEPLHPGRIAVVDLVESGRKLVADQVVLWG